MECKEYRTPVLKIEWLMNFSEIIPDNGKCTCKVTKSTIKSSIEDLFIVIKINLLFLEHVLSINANKRVIYDATLNDSNAYTCRASNEDGVTENHFNVTVKGVIVFFFYLQL